MNKIIALSALLVLGALGMACGDGGANNAATSANKMVANAMSNAANAMANAASQAQSAANTVANAVNNIPKPPTSMANNAMKPAPATNAAKPANK
jgi:ABC-type transport system involved in cytochrome bd biosynthesis fused ATPase/permease subunit